MCAFAYFGSLGFALYAALVAKSYVLVVSSCVLQVGVWFNYCNGNILDSKALCSHDISSLQPCGGIFFPKFQEEFEECKV